MKKVICPECKALLAEVEALREVALAAHAVASMQLLGYHLPDGKVVSQTNDRLREALDHLVGVRKANP
jgi:hypothetical protein